MRGISWVAIGKTVTIVVIFLVAFIPRSIELLSGNFVFGFDQGRHWLGAKSIVVDHKFPLIGDPVGGKGGFFQGPGWYYLLAIPFFLWHADPYGGIVLMVIAGMATVVLSLICMQKIFEWTTAVCISALVAVSPAIIIQSRFAWPPFIIPPLTIVYVYFLYTALTRAPVYFFWTFFICGIMAHFEMATALTLVGPTAVIALWYLFFHKAAWRTLLMAPFGFLVPLFPLAVFDLRHNFLNLHGLLAMVSPGGSGGILNTHSTVYAVNAFGAYEKFPAAQWVFVALHGLVLAAIGFDRNVSRKDKLMLAAIGCIPILVFFEFLFYGAQLWEWWLLELPIMYLIFTGYCAAYLWKKHVLGKLVVGVFFIFVFGHFVTATRGYYRTDFTDFGGTQKIKGKVQAVSAIFDDAAGTSFGLLVFTPPVYTYPYDFVSWWVGTRRYGYVPVAEKKGTFYLLIEPDAAKPWTYKGWLDTVVKTGDIVWQRTLPSGFIIEKRVSSTP